VLPSALATLGASCVLSFLAFPGCSSALLSGDGADPTGGEPTPASESSGITSGCSALPVTVTASASQAPNVPDNVLDNNLATRWSNYGVGSTLMADLGSVHSLCSVGVAWYRGNLRSNQFQILVSSDGTTFTKVFDGRSSGTTLQIEVYGFPNVAARYVHIVVNGNTENDWASITEARVHGVSGTTTCATCASLGKNCGTVSNGCGGSLNCGTCTSPQTCGGGGTANVCGATSSCTPTTCAAQGKNCGSISDGCGGALTCGSCTSPQTCGGGGAANVCGGGSSSGGGGNGTLTFVGTFANPAPGPNWPGRDGNCYTYIAPDQLRFDITSACDPEHNGHYRTNLCSSPGCDHNLSVGEVYPSGQTTCTTIPFNFPNGAPPPVPTWLMIAEAKDYEASFAGWAFDISPKYSGGSFNQYVLTFGGVSPGSNYFAWHSTEAVTGGWHSLSICTNNANDNSGMVYGIWLDGVRQTFNVGMCSGSQTCGGFPIIDDGAQSWPLDINAYTGGGGAVPVSVIHGAPLVATMGSNGLPPMPPGGWNSP
jgi:hypothetical protein